MEPFIGQIQPFGFNFAPRSWAFCNGQLLAIAQNTALFSLLGTIYGGDGRTTFALPDLRGRSPMHFGTGPGLSSFTQGAKSGSENTTLTTANLPAHTHTASFKLGAGPGLASSGANAYLASNAAGETTFTTVAPGGDALGADSIAIGNSGGNTSFNNRSPYLVVNYCIAVQGLFPSRN